MAPSKVWVIEIKSYPGKLEGDQGIWPWTPPDGDRALPRDNRLQTTNFKSKRLRSLLKGTAAFNDTKLRRNMPWFQPVVFLSDPSLTCMLDEGARTHIYGVDPEEGERVLDYALPGIIEVLIDPLAQSGRNRR